MLVVPIIHGNYNIFFPSSSGRIQERLLIIEVSHRQFKRILTFLGTKISLTKPAEKQFLVFKWWEHTRRNIIEIIWLFGWSWAQKQRRDTNDIIMQCSQSTFPPALIGCTTTMASRSCTALSTEVTLSFPNIKLHEYTTRCVMMLLTCVLRTPGPCTTTLPAPPSPPPTRRRSRGNAPPERWRVATCALAPPPLHVSSRSSGRRWRIDWNWRSCWARIAISTSGQASKPRSHPTSSNLNRDQKKNSDLIIPT